jgi:hypothetical protein
MAFFFRTAVEQNLPRGFAMSLRSLILTACVFAVAVPINAQTESEQEIHSLLERAGSSLDRYKELAADVRCDETIRQSLRDSCRDNIAMLADRVEEAKEKLTRYNQLPAPGLVDLFDIYDAFHRIMEGIQATGQPQGLYGERDQRAFAKIYNNFVKVTGWFGGVVRHEIENRNCR